MCFGALGRGSERIQGEATLCFNQSGTGFQGCIQAKDQSVYIITGAKSRRRKPCNESFGDYISEGDQGLPIYFDIHVVDCDIGEEYNLKQVQGRAGDPCTFECSCCSFIPDHVYRSQKAAMMAQKLLGHTSQGSYSIVSTGHITIICSATRNDDPWVL